MRMQALPECERMDRIAVICQDHDRLFDLMQIEKVLEWFLFGDFDKFFRVSACGRIIEAKRQRQPVQPSAIHKSMRLLGNGLSPFFSGSPQAKRKVSEMRATSLH